MTSDCARVVCALAFTLREEEAREPEAERRAALHPVVDEVEPQHEVFDPRRERLEARVRRVRPEARHLSRQARRVHLLELLAHHHQTFDGLPQLVERVLRVDAILRLLRTSDSRDSYERAVYDCAK